ncbi:molybdenum cofactor guanylyltransferase [Pseudofrankia sp. DC12]|uniref:molybdenum cofactor guanylyltransferase n=1 Tax=Pseudofrankia sp. DC12 TaxID=683315 RepID=UPI0005F7B20B|nr:molybdenum cofactor guanylyltransferase [Pseudofrankia sp. DC12]
MTGSPAARRGGVVLAGGRSVRMGTAKAALEWHGSTFLRRTVGIVGRAVDGPVVVVRASGQRLPDLPLGTLVVDDPREDKGPVQGMAAGLTVLLGRAESAFVASTDLPFLHPAFVTTVLRALDGPAGPDVVLPVARGYQQPLAAGYRTGLGELAARLVEQDRLRPAFLFEACAVLRLDEAALRADPVLAALDPDLDSLLNVNTPADYAAARARPAPAVAVRLVGAGGPPDPPGGPRLVPAATIQEAADAVRLPVGRAVTAALNGAMVTDAATPLVPGDAVSFLVAGPRG